MEGEIERARFDFASAMNSANVRTEVLESTIST